MNLSETSKKYHDAISLYIESQLNQIFKAIGIENEHHIPLFERALETKAGLENLTNSFKKQVENQGTALIDKKNFYTPHLQKMLQGHKKTSLPNIILEPKIGFESFVDFLIYQDIKAYTDKKKFNDKELQQLKRDFQGYARREQKKIH